MAAQASPIPADAPLVPRTMRLDPTGRPVHDTVPESLLERWSEDRAALQAQLIESATNHALEIQVLSWRIGELRSLISDGYMVGHDLRGLVYLFEKALVEDGPETPLTTASHIVIDCIRTMAGRLEALDQRASAANSTERAQ